MGHKVTLRGNYVDLRPLEEADAEMTLRWRLSQRARMLTSGAGNVEEQAAWIGSRPASEYNFVIALKDGTPVGMLSLIGVNEVMRHAETARFLIGEEDKVKGVPAAVEAMKLLYEFAFDTLKLARIYGNVASGNSLMVKWQIYLGMKQEGRMRDHYIFDGAFQDAVILGLLESEYRKESLPRMKALIDMARKSDSVPEGVRV